MLLKQERQLGRLAEFYGLAQTKPSDQVSTNNILIAIFRYLLDSVGVEVPPDENDLQILIDLLAFEVLRCDLSHISASKVIDGDNVHCEYLIEILYGIGSSQGLSRIDDENECKGKENLEEKSQSIEMEKSKSLRRFNSDSAELAAIIDDIPDSDPSPIEPLLPRRQQSFFEKYKRYSQSGIPEKINADKRQSSAKDLLSEILPKVEIPSNLPSPLLKKQITTQKCIVQNALRNQKLCRIKERNEKMAAIPDYFTKQIEHEIKLEEKKLWEAEKRAAIASLHNRRVQAVRFNKFQEEAKKNIKAIEFRRKIEEEKIMREVMEEVRKIEIEAKRESERLERERKKEEEERARIKAIAKNQRVADKIEMVKEEMRRLQQEELIRIRAEKEQIRREGRERKQDLRQDVRQKRDRIKTDAADFLYQNLDAERIMKTL